MHDVLYPHQDYIWTSYSVQNAVQLLILIIFSFTLFWPCTTRGLSESHYLTTFVLFKISKPPLEALKGLINILFFKASWHLLSRHGPIFQFHFDETLVKHNNWSLLCLFRGPHLGFLTFPRGVLNINRLRRQGNVFMCVMHKAHVYVLILNKDKIFFSD